MLSILFFTSVFTPFSAVTIAGDTLEEFTSKQSQLAELDPILQAINHEILSSCGLFLPHQQADSDIDSDASLAGFDMATPLEDLKHFVEYYSAVARFEQEASASLTVADDPPSIVERTGALLNRYTPDPDSEISEEHQLLVDRATSILAGYQHLRDHNNQPAISKVNERLQTLLDDATPGETATDHEAANILEALTDIESFVTNQVQASQLATRRTDVEQEWDESVRPIFGVRMDDMLGLPDDILDSDIPHTEIEAQLEVADQIIGLAEAAEAFDASTPYHTTSDLADDFSHVLNDAARSTDDLAHTVSILQSTLEVFEMCADNDSEYPSMPFNELAQQLAADIKAGTITARNVTEAENVLSAAETILKFLETVDSSHPSVSASEWRDSIRTALENIAPEILQPPLSEIERMGDTLWEREHLLMFSWDEFETLVGQVYEEQGYETNVTQQASDEGVDIWASKRGERVAIQVKQFSGDNKVGRPDLQKLVSTIAKDDADHAIVVTSNVFTSPAQTYAADFGTKIELVDGDELIRMLSESEIPPPV